EDAAPLAVEGAADVVVRVVPEDGVDVVVAGEAGARRRGAAEAEPDGGVGLVVPGEDRALELVEAAAGETRLAVRVGEEDGWLAEVEAEPADVTTAPGEEGELFGQGVPVARAQVYEVVGRPDHALGPVGEPGGETIEVARAILPGPRLGAGEGDRCRP